VKKREFLEMNHEHDFTNTEYRWTRSSATKCEIVTVCNQLGCDVTKIDKVTTHENKPCPFCGWTPLCSHTLGHTINKANVVIHPLYCHVMASCAHCLYLFDLEIQQYHAWNSESTCVHCSAVKIDCGSTPVTKNTLIQHTYDQGKCTKCAHTCAHTCDHGDECLLPLTWRVHSTDITYCLPERICKICQSVGWKGVPQVHDYTQGVCDLCKTIKCQHDYQVKQDSWITSALGCVSTQECTKCHESKINDPVDHKYENNKCVNCKSCQGQHVFVPKTKHGDYWYTLDSAPQEEPPELIQTVKNEPRCEQKRIIKESIQSERGDLRIGDTRYLVCAKWYKKWKSYVCYGSSESHSDVSPGAINNSILLDILSPFSDTCKKSLLQSYDYVLISPKTWQFLVSWYGGGPALPRKVISSGWRNSLKVEVRLLHLHITQYAAGPTEFIGVYSQSDTIGRLRTEVCTKLNLDPDHVTLWDFHARTKLKTLTNMKETLDESQIIDGQFILFEAQPGAIRAPIVKQPVQPDLPKGKCRLDQNCL